MGGGGGTGAAGSGMDLATKGRRAKGIDRGGRESARRSFMNGNWEVPPPARAGLIPPAAAGRCVGWKTGGRRLETGLPFEGHFNGSGAGWGHSDTCQETDPVEDRQRTNAQERAHLELMIELERQEQDWRDIKLRRSLIPEDWDKLETTAPVRPRRKKVTVALDEDVARWFRALGAGYHGRINAVLRTYMLALISKAVLSQGDRNRHGEETWGKAGVKRKDE